MLGWRRAERARDELGGQMGDLVILGGDVQHVGCDARHIWVKRLELWTIVETDVLWLLRNQPWPSRMLPEKRRRLREALCSDRNGDLAVVIQILLTKANQPRRRGWASHHKHPGGRQHTVNREFRDMLSRRSSISAGGDFNWNLCFRSNVSLRVESTRTSVFLRGPQGTTWTILNPLDTQFGVSCTRLTKSLDN